MNKQITIQSLTISTDPSPIDMKCEQAATLFSWEGTKEKMTHTRKSYLRP